MSQNDPITRAVVGDDTPTTELETKIGELTQKITDAADAMAKAKDEDTARWQTLKEQQDKDAAVLTTLQEEYQAKARDEATQKAIETAQEMRNFLAGVRTPAKSIGAGPQPGGREPYRQGDFLWGVHEANARDYERQVSGKAFLKDLAAKAGDDVVLGYAEDGSEITAKAMTYQEAWGEAPIWVGGKSTLGATDATGGWIVPNAVVDEFITPAAIGNIYRGLMTVVPGVVGGAVDIPFRSGIRNRAVIAAAGATKENRDLAYNGYTATMYTLAAIYDIGNQFLRNSRGAAERDVLSELAAAFAAGEAYYVREGSGSSEPFGYTSALTNGPSTFRSTFSSPSDSTVAGSMAAAISVAAGALEGRGAVAEAAVMSAASYWQMLRQGSDSAGFWFATQSNAPTSIRPGTLISPFGIPVYADKGADQTATAAVTDNLVVAQWSKFKLYFGQSYRVDSSDEAGTRWDTNLTGFRGEEEMGFDARPAVYAGYAQLITDVVP